MDKITHRSTHIPADIREQRLMLRQRRRHPRDPAVSQKDILIFLPSEDTSAGREMALMMLG